MAVAAVPSPTPPAAPRSARPIAALLGALAIGGCQSLAPPPGGSPGRALEGPIRVLAAPGSSQAERDRAAQTYRALVADRLPQVLAAAAQSKLVTDRPDGQGIYDPGRFDSVDPVRSARVREPGLHREGLGLPAVGLIEPGGPNAPRAGFRVPLTVLALPGEGGPGGLKSALVDPDRVDRVRTAWGKVPVAMDLDAAYSATASTGPRLGSGLANLLRPGLFGGRPRIVFLQPFDPDKTPVVLVHGLLSTPRMWEPLVRALLADPWVREHTQLWFFYYPTGQPVPLSALQLREALDEAVRVHKPRKPMILIGHSMGGILSRAQVSGIDLETARTMVPEIDRLSKGSLVRRALVFEPRTDVSRAVFMFTPHRGSRLANSSLAAWGIRLIRLPSTLLDEVSAVADYVAGIDGESLPTSIQGLSPESGFLRVLDGTRPSVPVHTVLGDRGRGDGAAGSDGVVPYLSATLPGAQSQLVVPTGHGGFAHPKAVEDLKRILKLSIEDPKPAARR